MSVQRPGVGTCYRVLLGWQSGKGGGLRERGRHLGKDVQTGLRKFCVDIEYSILCALVATHTVGSLTEDYLQTSNVYGWFTY